jgi:hypothetical protein
MVRSAMIRRAGPDSGEGQILSEEICELFQSFTNLKNKSNLKIMLIFEVKQKLCVSFCSGPNSLA